MVRWLFNGKNNGKISARARYVELLEWLVRKEDGIKKEQGQQHEMNRVKIMCKV